jgi:hypothetical protein
MVDDLPEGRGGGAARVLDGGRAECSYEPSPDLCQCLQCDSRLELGTMDSSLFLHSLLAWLRHPQSLPDQNIPSGSESGAHFSPPIVIVWDEVAPVW